MPPSPWKKQLGLNSTSSSSGPVIVHVHSGWSVDIYSLLTSACVTYWTHIISMVTFNRYCTRGRHSEWAMWIRMFFQYLTDTCKMSTRWTSFWIDNNEGHSVRNEVDSGCFT